MQYTSRIALLAVALFGTSAIALPFATEAEYDVEARETDTHLSAREFYDMYLEARADSVLNARELEAMDFEARDYINYLEARGTTSRTAADPANSAVIPTATHETEPAETHATHKPVHDKENSADGVSGSKGGSVKSTQHLSRKDRKVLNALEDEAARKGEALTGEEKKEVTTKVEENIRQKRREKKAKKAKKAAKKNNLKASNHRASKKASKNRETESRQNLEDDRRPSKPVTASTAASSTLTAAPGQQA